MCVSRRRRMPEPGSRCVRVCLGEYTHRHLFPSPSTGAVSLAGWTSGPDRRRRVPSGADFRAWPYRVGPRSLFLLYLLISFFRACNVGRSLAGHRGTAPCVIVWAVMLRALIFGELRVCLGALRLQRCRGRELTALPGGPLLKITAWTAAPSRGEAS